MAKSLWNGKLLEHPHEAPDKARRVRRMFDAIAPRYALINTIFSAGRDAYWRRRAVELVGASSTDDVLDVACGTGDFANAFVRVGVRSVIGCDFAHEMLVRVSRRRTDENYSCSERLPNAIATDAMKPRRPIQCVEADAMSLPFKETSSSIVSCAFGVRNFANLDAGLREMRRVLRPGGRLVILEFTRPSNRAVRIAYELYSQRLMPITASLVAGDRTGAYRYLPRSVVSFLDAPQMLERLRIAGFSNASATPLTFGVVTVYVAVRD